MEHMYEALAVEALILLVMGWYAWSGVLTDGVAVVGAIMLGAAGTGIVLFIAMEYYRQAQYWHAVLALGPFVDDGRAEGC